MRFLIKSALLGALFSIVFAAHASACTNDHEDFAKNVWIDAWAADLVLTKPSSGGEGCWKYPVSGKYKKFSYSKFKTSNRDITAEYSIIDLSDGAEFATVESTGSFGQNGNKNDGKLVNSDPALWCNENYYLSQDYDGMPSDALGAKEFNLNPDNASWEWEGPGYWSWDWEDYNDPFNWNIIDVWVGSYKCGGFYHTGDDDITNSISVKTGTKIIYASVTKSGTTRIFKGTLQTFDAPETEKWLTKGADQTVSVQKKSGKKWATVANGVTDENGKVTITLPNSKKASYRLRFGGDAISASSVSKTLKK